MLRLFRICIGLTTFLYLRQRQINLVTEQKALLQEDGLHYDACRMSELTWLIKVSFYKDEYSCDQSKEKCILTASN